MGTSSSTPSETYATSASHQPVVSVFPKGNGAMPAGESIFYNSRMVIQND